MVRIQRNDAPPRPKINLVSDDDNSSSGSSSSARSSSSSEEEVQPTPSPLSDFIEEDDEPHPLPKSSPSSWEPVKPRRRRITTLRSRPKLQDVDADEEQSISTTSTSSDGIPTPDVAADADEEESYVQNPAPTPPPVQTPSTRRRPRRAAAPRCFLDALNKFVEPMSKEAMQYTRRTIREIWHDQSDKDSQGQVSDGSSVEYVPHEPEEGTEDPAEETTHDDHQYLTSSMGNTPLRRGRVQSPNSYRNESSHIVHYDEEHDRERANTSASRNNEDSPVHYSPCQPSKPRRSLIDLSDTDEEIDVSANLKQKQESLNDPGEPVQAAPQCERINLVENATPISRPQKRENQVIDLCSDEEYVMPTAEEEFDYPNTAAIQSPGTYVEDGLQQDSNTTQKKERNLAQQNIERDCREDQHGGFSETTSIIKPEASDCLRDRNAYSISACDENVPPSDTKHRIVMHEQNARLAASLPQTQIPQTDSDGPVAGTLTRPNFVIKSESLPQAHIEQGDTDHNLDLRYKDCVRKRERKELGPTDGNWESDEAQPFQSARSNMASHGFRARHQPHQNKRSKREVSDHHVGRGGYGNNWKRRRNR